MKSSHIVLLIVLAVLFGLGGFWLARSHDEGQSQHHWLKKTDTQGKSYWTCAMHPQVHQDHPGNCPACGMKLIEKQEAQAPASGMTMERKPLYWVDPMKPEVHFDKPGQSPFMDMQLVAKYADAPGVAASGGVVSIDPRMAQNLGVRTAKVLRGTFWQRVDATGSIVVDERAIHVVESRTAGFIEQLKVRATGDAVNKGQTLAALYAPDTLAVQEELALARKSGDAALMAAAQSRLRLLGAAPASGNSVPHQTGLVSPVDGVVLELMAREGQQLAPGMPLMKVADLHTVWAEVEVPEAQSSRVRMGAAAELRSAALPGETFEAKVDFIYPQVTTATRTLKVRLVLDNPRLALRPGMYAEVVLFGGPRHETLLVPSEAVIRTGSRSIVILSEGDGHFRPAQVTVGDEREGQTEILTGVQEGETIVSSGQFLIDSEASLQGVLARMSAPVSQALPRDTGEGLSGRPRDQKGDSP